MRYLMLVGARGRRIWRAQLALCLLTLITCDNPTGPRPGDAVAVVFGLTNELSDSSRVAAVAVPEGLRLPDGEPLERFIGATTISTDSATVYGDEFIASPGQSELFALDLRTLRVRWHEPGSTIAARSAIGPMSIEDVAVATNLSGRQLFVTAGTPNGPGIVALDLTTRTPVAFMAGIVVTGGSLALAPSRPGFPEGVLLAVGHRPDADSSENTIFLIDPVALAVVDSIPNLIPPPNAADEFVVRLVVATNGRDVYADTRSRGLARATVLRIDLDARAVLARTPTTSFAAGMAASPDGSTVFVADAGDGRDTPGSGTIFRYDAALHPLPPIQLPTNLPPSRHLLVTNFLAVSADSRTLYATSGDADLGPSFGFKPARLLIIDLPTGSVRAVPLGDSEPTFVYLHRAVPASPSNSNPGAAYLRGHAANL